MTNREIHAAVAENIAAYCRTMRKSAESFDNGLREQTEQFLYQLEHTDTMQAELVVAGYFLCGGTDTEMILVASRALQMTHVYAETYRSGVQNTIGALNGQHAAQIMLANVDAGEEVRLKAVSITNRALLLYMHGVAAKDTQSEAALDCFATELTLNPLHVGMVLAGADCAATDQITAFAMNAGRSLLADDDRRTQQYASRAAQDLSQCILWPQKDLAPIAELCNVRI